MISKDGITQENILTVIKDIATYGLTMESSEIIKSQLSQIYNLCNEDITLQSISPPKEDSFNIRELVSVPEAGVSATDTSIIDYNEAVALINVDSTAEEIIQQELHTADHVPDSKVDSNTVELVEEQLNEVVQQECAAIAEKEPLEHDNECSSEDYSEAHEDGPELLPKDFEFEEEESDAAYTIDRSQLPHDLISDEESLSDLDDVEIEAYLLSAADETNLSVLDESTIDVEPIEKRLSDRSMPRPLKFQDEELMDQNEAIKQLKLVAPSPISESSSSLELGSAAAKPRNLVESIVNDTVFSQDTFDRLNPTLSTIFSSKGSLEEVVPQPEVPVTMDTPQSSRNPSIDIPRASSEASIQPLESPNYKRSRSIDTPSLRQTFLMQQHQKSIQKMQSIQSMQQLQAVEQYKNRPQSQKYAKEAQMRHFITGKDEPYAAPEPFSPVQGPPVVIPQAPHARITVNNVSTSSLNDKLITYLKNVKTLRTTEDKINVYKIMLQLLGKHQIEMGETIKPFYASIIDGLKKCKDVEAYYLLGSLYKQGNTGKQTQDWSKAFKYFSMGSKGGHSKCRYFAAYCYTKGLGCRIDLNVANRYFLSSANSGITAAMAHCGDMYLYGIYNCNRDRDQALYWYRNAASTTEPTESKLYALFRLGFEFINSDTEHDQEYAFSCLNKGIQYVPCLYGVACCLEFGIGCPVDKQTSEKYFDLAAAKGYKEMETISELRAPL